MDFSPPARSRAPRESVVPMINVVFLLLIFFLMSAQIASPDPADVTPPSVALSDGPLKTETAILWLTVEGRLLDVDGATPDLALVGKQISLRAEATASATDLVRVLRELGLAGVQEVTLVARRGGG